ncbi:hypothetical protein NVP1087A_42 [Vibrio phage 1.087.A._10N.261.45.F9]|nr:hypothetical protein NVP1087A_42 [Vibrio phage 1.087.A._10N.261.45.F9]
MKLFHIATSNNQYKTHYGLEYALKKGESFVEPQPTLNHTLLGRVWVKGAHQIAQQAKQTRDTAISADIIALEVEWQMLDDASDVRKVLQDSEITNAVDSDSVQFRLADNSWRTTTLAELKQVLALHVSRKREVWAQFNEWDDGDKSQPFEVIL